MIGTLYHKKRLLLDYYKTMMPHLKPSEQLMGAIQNTAMPWISPIIDPGTRYEKLIESGAFIGKKVKFQLGKRQHIKKVVKNKGHLVLRPQKTIIKEDNNNGE